MTPAPSRTPAHPERLEQGHPFRQWKTWRIPGTELTLTGYSRANDKTMLWAHPDSRLPEQHQHG
ncbi:hypothetical protein ACIQZO_31100 [Streptomyces sp. NPDC097617]|uniref:hypothetical protein n=1 Tax=Streptomyces sp. NPDC097617 TaxID=3366091 RepID=UPI0038269955